jgi:hypothetical protein
MLRSLSPYRLGSTTQSPTFALVANARACVDIVITEPSGSVGYFAATSFISSCMSVFPVRSMLTLPIRNILFKSMNLSSYWPSRPALHNHIVIVFLPA